MKAKVFLIWRGGLICHRSAPIKSSNISIIKREDKRRMARAIQYDLRHDHCCAT
jgi:hypothetical protein